jgi:predicted amino acid-binding ACT domain protein
MNTTNLLPSALPLPVSNSNVNGQPINLIPNIHERQLHYANALPLPPTLPNSGINSQIPEGFELPTVQHRLDPRWQLCWYKSTGHFHNRRRYTAKCISCGYELEGRPERMARHILTSCTKVSHELKAEYRKELERTGKFQLNMARTHNHPRSNSNRDDSKEEDSSSEQDNEFSQIESGNMKKRKRDRKLSPVLDSTDSLLNLMNESSSNPQMPVARRQLSVGSRTTELNFLSSPPLFVKPPGDFSFEELLVQILLECNMNQNLLTMIENSYSLQELFLFVPDFVTSLGSPSRDSQTQQNDGSDNALFPSASKFLYKIIPELERKYYLNLSNIFGQDGKWTLLLTSQILMNGMMQFFIVAKYNEMTEILGVFKLALDSPNMNNHALMIETIYTNIWNRIDTLNISRNAFASTIPHEFYLSSNGLGPMVAIGVSALPNSVISHVLGSQQQPANTAASTIYYSPNHSPNLAPLPVVNPITQMPLTSVGPLTQQLPHLLNSAAMGSPQYHFLRIDLKDADAKLLSIPCILTSLQSILRYFATIVKPLSLIKEVFVYLLHHPIWLSAVNHFLSTRNQYIPLIATLSSKDYLFSLYYCYEIISIYLFAIREILAVDSLNKFLPPITQEISEIINNPNHIITLTSYCKVMKPIVEGIELILAEKHSVTLAHSLKVLLQIESALLRMNCLEAYSNDLRTAVLNKFREITVQYELDLFIVSLFLWPRYKSLVVSKKYDYSTIRQGILRLANTLKCFAIDQAYQLIHEIDKYQASTPPFNFTEEQLDLNAKELWETEVDPTNVLCIIAKKLYDITPTSYTINKEIIHKYNSFMNFHDEAVSEKLLFLTYYHQSQNVLKRKTQQQNSLSDVVGVGNGGVLSTTSSPRVKNNPLLAPAIQNPSKIGSVASNLSHLNLPSLAISHSSNNTPRNPVGGVQSLASTAFRNQQSSSHMTNNPQSVFTTAFPSPLNHLPNPKNIDDVSLTWIDNEIKNIHLVQEKENNEMSNNYRTRFLSMDELFDLNVFIQIETVVKMRQENIVAREREQELLKVQQYDWDPASLLADYERTTKN